MTDASVWAVRVAHAFEHVGDYAVDLAAIVALYGLAAAGVTDANAQVLGGFIVSVALGKRYVETKYHTRSGDGTAESDSPPSG